MKTILKVLFVCFLLSAASSQCFALMSLKDIFREQTKALGVVVRSHGDGQAGVNVWLEFKTQGELKNLDRVELRIGVVEKPLVSAPLLATHPSPGSVAVHFSADWTVSDSHGETNFVFRVQVNLKSERLKLDELFIFAAFLLAPQLPPGADWRAAQWRALTLDALHSVQTNTAVDARRLYLTGLSLGAMGMFDYLPLRSDLFAAAVPMSGTGATNTAPLFKDVPIWLFSQMITPKASTKVTLVPMGSLWTYLDDGSNQGTGWRGTNFNDSAWPSGPAPFGDEDEATNIQSNRLDNTRIITTCFRKKCVATDLWTNTNLYLKVLRDDGCMVYLNGVEVFRDNMPAATAGFPLNPQGRGFADTIVGH